MKSVRGREGCGTATLTLDIHPSLGFPWRFSANDADDIAVTASVDRCANFVKPIRLPWSFQHLAAVCQAEYDQYTLAARSRSSVLRRNSSVRKSNDFCAVAQTGYDSRNACQTLFRNKSCVVQTRKLSSVTRDDLANLPEFLEEESLRLGRRCLGCNLIRKRVEPAPNVVQLSVNRARNLCHAQSGMPARFSSKSSLM